MHIRALRFAAVAALAVAIAAGPAAAADVTVIAGPTETPASPVTWDFAAATTHLLAMQDELLGKQTPPKLPGPLAGIANYTGNDSCRWANDGECDDPGIGTGACQQGTDYSDCWRIVTQREDDSCEYANNGHCDEPRFGSGVCTQGTDRTDCGIVVMLRFEDDSCIHAFNGVCNETARGGDGSCDRRTDRSDCIGRDRPLTIDDHYFGRDDRMLMDTTVAPWNVIGLLVGDFGGCTATLIAVDVLLTAAHCIETENGVNADQVFETAFGPGGGGVSARVTAWLLGPTRASDVRTDDEPSQSDWALLRLDTPLGEKLGFLEVRGFEAFGDGILQMPVSQAGYSWDTGDHLSGNVGCSFLTIEAENTVLHNCDTTNGDSGSPLMVRDGDAYVIVAVDSSFRFGQPVINVATRTDAVVPFLADFIAGRTGNTELIVAGTAEPGKK
ncbi:MAG: trypsin-like peptidase domain-containing protein [Bauldia sp.]|nr:trypsin-like peptidase domain-containing protein [Bauldia sp.]